MRTDEEDSIWLARVIGVAETREFVEVDDVDPGDGVACGDVDFDVSGVVVIVEWHERHAAVWFREPKEVRYVGGRVEGSGGWRWCRLDVILKTFDDRLMIFDHGLRRFESRLRRFDGRFRRLDGRLRGSDDSLRGFDGWL